ncbi:MAG: hypothetical protein AW11_03430 [Candidatus Accumulibacter regalis]|jgi:uncharacterized membrane protein|uniref:Uncharacterized protein n=1 Tax=Accumulibacter regalis TaxID=522306 RepID=A0A011Q8Q6_ACCRE|nr:MULTISPECIES: hypothetical protein [unclassified Candidatus Accumulibacter]EXI85602.1 MAG: hypothetical protein AW11_03430 [Candidatus Accumulibacter regalis]MBN8513530.1 hypothetical protein [Accumulibacter sp.]MBO3701794.1 hypothetical protein [Accumulibacter sp.]HRE72599.1 hypothetical protein [Accumulibacter sp.]
MATNGHFFNQVNAPIKVVHSNLDQEIIQITEDKLRLVLNQHIAAAEQRKAWIAPLGILVAIVIVFSTSTFKDVFFKAPTWEAIFFIAGLLSLGWLIRTLWQAHNSPTVDSLVEKIKNRSIDEQSNK